MKGKKLNYRALTISKYMEANEMTLKQATTAYNKIYRTALREIQPEARQDFNMAKEIFASSFNLGENVFTIDAKNKKITINAIYEGTSDIKQDITLIRMMNFETKFSKDSPNLRKIFADYRSGNISRTEFNAKIKEWKKLSIAYMISGSK